MSLSENIKKARLDRKLTQEQLAEKLGVSPQAVSKWETSETYPDGALLVPLSNALGVSLDELFGNDSFSLADISHQIISLLHNTPVEDRFHVVRDICWQIERGLFNCRMEIDKKYDPDEIKNQKNASYIIDDTGFTMVSNGKEPFFAVFPQPEEGFGHFLNDMGSLQKKFEALSHTDTVKAILWLYRKTEDYIFESAVLAGACQIKNETMDDVMSDLALLGVVRRQELVVDGHERVLYFSHPRHQLIALFLVARELGYPGAYSLQSHCRNTPLLSEGISEQQLHQSE